MGDGNPFSLASGQEWLWEALWVISPSQGEGRVEGKEREQRKGRRGRRGEEETEEEREEEGEGVGPPVFPRRCLTLPKHKNDSFTC